MRYPEAKTLSTILDRITDSAGVDEVMIQHIHATHDHALRSHELLADGIGLKKQF